MTDVGTTRSGTFGSAITGKQQAGCHNLATALKAGEAEIRFEAVKAAIVMTAVPNRWLNELPSLLPA
jgi:hypothetical protein